ncbi:hypothetical protein KIN20_036712 [Parelaphostrongylus tenuis]|uniref:Uncharacterized protein n=1 Tax=Parelaphostrongylus tenuis TaxID=148309 RepID=A0AAD5RD80_PARTN|nr:hypothetical protein KIN20_036712 [Parelaphostrongylus tenuis]
MVTIMGRSSTGFMVLKKAKWPRREPLRHNDNSKDSYQSSRFILTCALDSDKYRDGN